jgi:hypothetical protein
MNTKDIEKVSETPIVKVITEGLLKLNKKEPTKEGVNLLDITKKISTKKFGKR